MTPSRIALNVPSPVRALINDGERELWVKDDGKVCSDYGGNKPRKLVRLLDEAQRSAAQHLVTVGVVGSHHVLATALLGRKLGLDTTAISLPRPYSEHAEQTTRRSLAAGVKHVCALTPSDVLKLARCLVRRGNFWIPPGGSNVLGTLGYLDALLELEQQVHDGLLPEPDLIFVALGSGGTAAGLLAGLALSTLHSRIVAIPVMHLPMARSLVETLAARAALRVSGREVSTNWTTRLELDARWVGKGYGFSTQAGESAIEIAAKCGLSLESTYTGKAFAAALEWLRWPVDRGTVVARHNGSPAPNNVRSLKRAPQRALFWSTISTTKDSQTDSEAVTLSPSLARLLRDGPKRLPRD